MAEGFQMQVDNVLMSFHPFIALLFGTFVGLLAQTISARLRHNGKWHEMTSGRKWALRWSGALAAYGVGLWILDHPAPNSVTPYIYRLWLWQLVAAWGGTAVLDAGVQLLMIFIKSRASAEGGGGSGRGDD